jgi:hypothetical protein
MRSAFIVVGLAIGATGIATAQSGLHSPGPDPYVIKPLRWEEDYSRYQPPADANLPERLKRVALGDGFVSFGGEARWRVEHTEATLFGVRGAPDFTSSATRFLAHADYHSNADWRMFVQLNASDERGRRPRERAADESAVDLAQGFVDWNVSAWRLRAGRQELAFGRYVTTRDGTNLRRTFDGVRATGPVAGGTLDLVGDAVTRQRPGAFDDDPDPEDHAWGAAFTYPLADKSGRLIATYFGRRNGRAVFASGTGEEFRHAFAVRLQRQRGDWDFDGQFSAQTGELRAPTRTLDLAAWGFATETGLTWRDAAWRPRLALRLDGAGGDKDAGDGKLGTFDLAYPNLTYISDAAAFAPRNLWGVQPFVTVQPHSHLSVTIGEDVLWRVERGDAIYAPGGVIVAPANGVGGLVASQTYLRAAYAPTQHLEWTLSIVEARAGEAIRNAGGRDQLFAGGHLALRF